MTILIAAMGVAAFVFGIGLAAHQARGRHVVVAVLAWEQVEVLVQHLIGQPVEGGTLPHEWLSVVLVAGAWALTMLLLYFDEPHHGLRI